MIALAYYLLKLITCSGLLFLYYQLCLRNKLFHRWNRFYLLAAVMISLLAPIMQLSILQRFSENPNKAIKVLQVIQSADGYLEEITIGGHRRMSAGQWLTIAYLSICAVILVSIMLSLKKVFSIIRSHRVQRMGKIRFINTSVPGTPFSFFDFIFWNEAINLNTETGQQIFQHELVHVKEKHTLDKLFIQLILVFFWCNPFFWLVRRELKLIHEFIADQNAVGEHGSAALAAMILNTSYPSHFNAVTNHFFQTSIKRRLRMLTKIQNPKVNYLSRVLALPILVITVLAFTLRTKNIVSSSSFKLEKPIVVVIDSSHGLMRNEQYAWNQQETKKNEPDTVPHKNQDHPSITNNAARGAQPSPLFLLDGREVSKEEALKTEPSTIESINILKDKPAIDKYGRKGLNGVVEIKLKEQGSNKDIDFQENGSLLGTGTIKMDPETNTFHGTINTSRATAMDTIPQQQPIFEKAEVEASVNKEEWTSFLQKNLHPFIVEAAAKGIAPGSYTVKVRFLVKKDGSISDFQALNDPGYGLTKNVLTMMKDSPKWNPARQNDKPVNSYHTQPITFVIQEE